jgi:hypothetical protein
MSLTINAQIDRVEPPFWYAGMHNPELEILFYGKNIAQYEVTTSNSITNIKKDRTRIIYLLPSTLKMLLLLKLSFRLKTIKLLLHISTA